MDLWRWLKRQTHIEVGGHRYRLEWRKLDAEDGLCDRDRCAIVLLDGMHRAEAEVTLLHEVIHMAEGVGGFELREWQVQALATALHQALFRRPTSPK